MKFRIFIEAILPPIWRKPKWVGLLQSISKPVQDIYTETTGVFLRLKRRAACDGSVIALEYLLEEEFGKRVKIIETNFGSRSYIKQRGEALKGIHLHSRADGGVYLHQRGAMDVDTDYTVKMLEPETNPETIQRIAAVVRIYNATGFTYKVTN